MILNKKAQNFHNEHGRYEVGTGLLFIEQDATALEAYEAWKKGNE